MIERIVDVDAVASFLFERSTLSRTQLDTYLAARVGRQEERGLREKIALRVGRRVSKGAFLTTLRQAHRRLERAVYSILLLQYLGVLDARTTAGLVRTGEMLRRAKEEGASGPELGNILHATATIVRSAVQGL